MGFLASIAGFAVGNWQRLAIYALVVLMVVGTAAGWGYHKGVQQLYDYQVKEATAAVKVITLQGKVTTQVVTKYIKVREAATRQQATIREEIHHYANAGLCLDPEWRRLHDAAAAGAVPGAAGGTDATADAPKAAAALVTVSENYGAHNDCADRLEHLQEWIRGQRLANP